MRKALFVLLALTLAAAVRPSSAVYISLLVDMSGWGDAYSYPLDYTNIQANVSTWTGPLNWTYPAQISGGTAQITTSGLEWSSSTAGSTLYLPPIATCLKDGPFTIKITVSSVQGTLDYGVYVYNVYTGESTTIDLGQITTPTTLTMTSSNIFSSIKSSLNLNDYDPLVIYPIIQVPSTVSTTCSITISKVTYNVNENVAAQIASIARLLDAPSISNPLEGEVFNNKFKGNVFGAINSYDLAPGLGFDPSSIAEIFNYIAGVIHKGFGNPRLIPPTDLIKNWLLVSITMDKYYANYYSQQLNLSTTIPVYSALACMGPIFPQLFDALKWAGIKFLLVLPSVKHGGRVSLVNPADFGAPTSLTIQLGTKQIPLSMFQVGVVNGIYTLFPIPISVFYDPSQPATLSSLESSIYNSILKSMGGQVIIFYFPAEAADSTDDYPFAYYNMIVATVALENEISKISSLFSSLKLSELGDIFSIISSGQLLAGYIATLQKPIDAPPTYPPDWLTNLYNNLNNSKIISLLNDISNQLSIIFKNGWYYTPNVLDDGQPFLNGKPFQEVVYANNTPPYGLQTTLPLLNPNQYVDAWLEMIAWEYVLELRNLIDDMAEDSVDQSTVDTVVTHLEYLGYKLHQITAENGSDTTTQVVSSAIQKVVDVEKTQAAWARLVTDLLAMLLNMVGLLVMAWMVLGV